MSIEKLLNKKVSEAFGLSSNKNLPEVNLYGVEVEVEGRKLWNLRSNAGAGAAPAPVLQDFVEILQAPVGTNGPLDTEVPQKLNKPKPPAWTATSDGSLKGPENLEYVLALPYPLEETVKHIEDLYANFKAAGTQVHDSMRAGVHVHVNCRHLTIKQMFTFLAAYHALEVVLTNNFGEDRIGNLFCLRLVDSDYLGITIRNALLKEKLLEYFKSDHIRYSAGNLVSLTRYGTIEFRALKTPTTKDSIINWVRLLDTLLQNSLKFKDPASVLNFFSADGEVAATKVLLGDFAKTVINQPNFSKDVITSIRAAQLWVYSTNWSSQAKEKM